MRLITLTVTGLITAGLCGRDVAAQRLAAWPIRTSALPDAIVRNVGAVFWNPAGLSSDTTYRGHGMVINMRAPETFDLNGLAGAGSFRVERTTLALAYEHVGVGGITQTDDSPTGTEFDVGENQFTLAAAHQVNRIFTVGASARYARDDLNDTDATVAVGAGLTLEPRLPLRTLLGAYAFSEADAVLWGAGLEVRLPRFAGPDYDIGLAYGAQTDGLLDSPQHRVSALFEWDQHASVSAGLTRQPEREGANWAPILAAGLRLNRYTLGVVRESLVHDFGATYTFRLQVGLGP